MRLPSKQSSRRRLFEVGLVLVVVAAVVGFGRNLGGGPLAGPVGSTLTQPTVETPQPPPPSLPKVDGVEITRLKRGEGEPITKGQAGSFHYTGWLDGFNGKEFDSSLDRDQSFSFKIGQGMVIPGWDQGLMGMQAKEVRRLKVAPEMAFGEVGRRPDIPPHSTVYFEVEYLGLAKE